MGTNLVEVVMWWPPLALLWLAAVPHSGLVAVAGIGVGLVVLGLVDAAIPRWADRTERGIRRYGSQREGVVPVEIHGGSAAAHTSATLRRIPDW
jgi:hypothetical protein